MTAAETTTKRLLRSAVIELLRSALSSDRSMLGATRELVRVADGEHLESELLEVLKAAVALVGDGLAASPRRR